MKKMNTNQKFNKLKSLLTGKSRLIIMSIVLCLLLGNVSNTYAQEKAIITHGPMLGRVGAHEIGVWARTFKEGTFWVRYGTDPKNLDQLSDSVTTTVAHDNTGWAHIQNLKANTKYYYALTVKGGNQTMSTRSGSFKTLSDPNEMREATVNPEGLFNFSFEFACGNSQGVSGIGTSLPTFRTMLDNIKDKIDFAILNGDWLYEAEREYTKESWLKQVGITEEETPDVVKYDSNIVGVWENYKDYLDKGQNMVEWHKNVPSFYTIDDHEIYDNTYGAGQIGRVDHKAVYRDPAVQAWYDYLAWSNHSEFVQGITFGRTKLSAGSDILTDTEKDFTKLDLNQSATLDIHWGGPNLRKMPVGSKPIDPNSGVYQVVEVIDAHNIRIFPAIKETFVSSYSIGRRSYGKMTVSNADIFLLDMRSHQDMYDINDPNKKGISIMGNAQKAWLKEEMAKSDADFFFVVSSVNFTIPHRGGTGATTADKLGGSDPSQTGRDDAWTIFIEERKEMIDFWTSLGKPVFVLAGDLHDSFAVQVSETVFEFAAGPHNSRNHTLGAEGDRPINGKYTSVDREVDIHWSTFNMNDVPLGLRDHPNYCVVKVNNVFNNPLEEGKDRWVAYPKPQVIFQYYDGYTGELLYAESILSTGK
jgi:phosphodiesterase/alkaline phosphatase D-like protein